MNHSPLPTQVIIPGMSFPEAMQAVIDGKRVSKREWKQSVYAELRNGFLEIFRGDTTGQWHTWTISDGDLFGVDYFIVTVD